MSRLRHLLALTLLLGSIRLVRADVAYWRTLFRGDIWVRAIAVDPQTPTTIYIGLSRSARSPYGTPSGRRRSA